jgi:hypothetical protein
MLHTGECLETGSAGNGWDLVRLLTLSHKRKLLEKQLRQARAICRERTCQ